jgi:putative flippase GtrA
MPDARVSPVVLDLLRFTAVGGIGVVVDIVLFNVLRTTLLRDGSVTGAVLIAKGVATSVAILANWAGNRWWTFRDRRRARVLPELLSFIAASAMGSAVALVCLAISHYALGFTSTLADNISANVIGLALGSLLRFVLSRRWVFRPGARAAA